jgi:hypothetical protein
MDRCVDCEPRWTFQSRSDGSCDIGFHLHYELASRTLALLMGAVFDAAFGRFVEAFERRADIVYGRPRAACRSARSLRSPQRERPQNVSVSFS